MAAMTIAAIATISMRVDISKREEFLLAAGTEDGIPKPVQDPELPEVVWLSSPQYPVTPSVENMARALEKMHSIQNHRGLVMSELGPGIRVWPGDFAAKAAEILDDGTPQGAAMLRQCLARAFGTSYDVSGVPTDMSRKAVQTMLQRRARWPVEVLHPKRMKEVGVRKWRVLARGAEHPKQIEHRGHLILVTKATKSQPTGVVRKPKARGGRKQSSGKGQGKGTHQQRRPKWLDEWKETKEEKEEAAPGWSRKSWASVVTSSKSESEVKEEEDSDSDLEEDTDKREAAEVPVPASPGGASPKRRPKGGGAASVSFGPGSSTGSSTSPAKPHAGGMSTLEAQLTALMPALMEMVDAHVRSKVASAPPPAETASSVQPAQEGAGPQPAPPGHKTGAVGLKPGDEGYRAPHNDVTPVVGDAAAAAKARSEAAAQKRREDRERQLAEQRASAEAAGGSA